MHWTLIVLTLGGTPVSTGMTFTDIDSCYAAEEQMANEYARYFNDWKVRSKTEGIPDFWRERLMRGVCIPRESQ